MIEILYLALMFWLTIMGGFVLIISVALVGAMLFTNDSPLRDRLRTPVLWVLRVVYIIVITYATVVLGVCLGRGGSL